MNNNDSNILHTLLQMITESKVEKLEQLAQEKTNYLTVALENIYQEHNASAVIRTCECLGIQSVHAIEKDNEYKIQRDIARGAANWVNLTNYTEVNPTENCINNLKEKGYKIVATSPHKNDYNTSNIPIDRPLALFFGTEMKGLSNTVLKEADYFLKIPMHGFTESLNISVSAGIILSELRNRLSNSKIPYLLDEEQQIRLKIQWCTKIIKEGEKIEEEIRKRIIEKTK